MEAKRRRVSSLDADAVQTSAACAPETLSASSEAVESERWEGKRSRAR